jgi:PleD family two-component response regulator
LPHGYAPCRLLNSAAAAVSGAAAADLPHGAAMSGRLRRGFALERLSVLIVDDNRYMIMLIAEILLGLGIRNVAKFTDPADAFKELAILPVDLVVCDHAMNLLSGIEFVQMLRTSKDSPNPFVPVIMVSGYGDMATVTAARDAGVSEFLIKPISAKSLYMRVLEVINNPRAFIRSKTYFGPNRRRRDQPFEGEEKRVKEAMEIPESSDDPRLYPIDSV